MVFGTRRARPVVEQTACEPNCGQNVNRIGEGYTHGSLSQARPSHDVVPTGKDEGKGLNHSAALIRLILLQSQTNLLHPAILTTTKCHQAEL